MTFFTIVGFIGLCVGLAYFTGTLVFIGSFCGLDIGPLHHKQYLVFTFMVFKFVQLVSVMAT